MENTTAFSPSLESVLLSLENLQVHNNKNGGGAGGATDDNSFALPQQQPFSNGFSSSTRRFQEKMSKPVPLFSQETWATTNNLFNSGDCWEDKYMNYGYDTNSGSSSGSGESLASVWANSGNPIRGKGYNFSNYYDGTPFNGMTTQNYLVTPQYTSNGGLNIGEVASQYSSLMCNGGLYNGEVAPLNGFRSNGGLYNGEVAPQNGFRSNGGLNNGEVAFELLKDYDIIVFGRSRNGSQYLQKILSWKEPVFTDKIFQAVFMYPFDLMNDQYGHHLIGKFIDVCEENQRKKIVLHLTSQSELFFTASVNRYGSIFIKKLIKVIGKTPLVSLVVLAIHKRFKDTMNCTTGSSVVMQCLETLDDKQNELLYVAAINSFRDIATSVKGCIALNNFINDMRGPHRAELLDVICSHAVFLSKDPCGNFVVQNVLELRNPDLIKKICSVLKGKYVDLSTLRCGSHVVEKCLYCPGMMEDVVDDLTKSSKQLLQLARHKFGNYVVQKALKATKECGNLSLHEKILVKLSDYDALQIGFGRNVYNLIINGVPLD